MSNCTHDCNQGRNCTCKGNETDYEKEYYKMNTFIKFLLFITAIYFLGHIAYALADSPRPAPPPVIHCIPTGSGSMTCYPI